MSRIIKEKIILPDNIKITRDNNLFILSSDNGILKITNNNFYDIDIKDRNIFLFPKKDKKNNAKLGTFYSILQSNILGLCQKFKKILLLVGVGYKAYIENKNLYLNLGYSHKIIYKIPDDIEIKCNKNEIHIEGINKQRVGQIAAEIRLKRKPDIYKGKGIRYLNEKIILKEIKKKK